MKIKIENTAPEAAITLAQMISNQVRLKANSTIGLATGRTMNAVYYNLIEKTKQNPLDFENVSAFAIDEYIGLEKGDPNSYASYLDLHVFNHLNFKKENIHIPNVFAKDLDLASFEYEQKIKECNGLDLVILGIGLNGHIGLNEPGSAEDSRTRVVALTQSTRNSNKSVMGKKQVPLTAITMGIGTILSAKKCVLLATGETKAEIIQKLVNGDISSKIPASALKQHKDFELILDKDAAKLI